MTFLTTLRAGSSDWFDPRGREQQLKEYAGLLNQLIWKRQTSFLAAVVLAAAYFDTLVALLCYVFVLFTEFLDERLGRFARSWDGEDPVMGRRILRRIAFNTVLSAIGVCSFVISIAIQQTSGGHFTPLFILFSASLFAAMYNSQILSILILRLSIYLAGFVFVAFLDVFRYAPPLKSTVWLEFFTIIFVIYFLIDISWKFYLGYRRNLEQMKLVEKEAELARAALAVKSQFVSVVSHELRTPLTSIKGSIDLINSGAVGELPQKARSLLEIAGRNSHRLALLIDDLLDLQKMEAGEMSFRFEPLDVHATIHEAIESTSGFATKLGIHVQTELEAPGCTIMGDRNRLVQALQNLLSNAMKFSNEGGTVTVSARPIGSRVRVSVRDRGVGIPEGAEDRVFGKFTQVDSSEKRKVGGTGLGLNITKQIAERHDATIEYESELGTGTVFYMEFNRVTGSEAPEEVPVRPQPARLTVASAVGTQ
ncbi:sensor histidine kinase [Wenxinia marina]|uniref:histidine kinase n=1 Tax=Wenxinia marina DSM 24838 TaxID=1123501 RepID=A0A0D0Q735_9RHOB|nr:HAMP domain-containing sensor histidine kinase [Wenxinia marina]KIQ68257.1 Signal transduction histidine kinase [Wenxinia marina DSM 24838]GGL77164.1 hypothetical protein GCM10011392_34520 [Wenxinia marina]